MEPVGLFLCGTGKSTLTASVWLGCVDRVEEDDAGDNGVRVEKEL